MSQGIESKPRKRTSARRAGGVAVALAVPPDVQFTISPDDFGRLCQANPDLRLEREANGELIVMPPAAPDSGYRNAGITSQVWNWNQRTARGIVFDSSTGFTLPNSAIRGPDTSWMTRERWDALPADERRRFSQICPDFVVELRSGSDDMSKLEAKMAEYVAQGVRLGWLIDPQGGTIRIYRPGKPVEVLVKPATLSGEDVLPGFVLDLKGILFD